MTVCTEEFLGLAKVAAQSLRMPHIAIVVVPHPIGGIDLKDVIKKADDILEATIEALTLPRERLPERAANQIHG